MEIALFTIVVLLGLAAMRFADEPSLPVTAPSEETVAHAGFDPAEADEPPPAEDLEPPPVDEVITAHPAEDPEPEPTAEVEPEAETAKGEEPGPAPTAWLKAWERVKPPAPEPTAETAKPDDRLSAQERLDVEFAKTVRAQQAVLAARTVRQPEPERQPAPEPTTRRLSFEHVIDKVVPKDIDPEETITAQQFRDGVTEVASEVAGTVAREVQETLSGQLSNERLNEGFRTALNAELDSYEGITDKARPLLRNLVFDQVNRSLTPADRDNEAKIRETTQAVIRDVCLETGWFHGQPAGGKKKAANTAGVLAVNAAGTAKRSSPEDVDLLSPTEVVKAIG